MTTTLTPDLMPAQQHPDTETTTGTGTAGEEVKAVALFESSKRRDARAWDELSEIDRQVLLESVRQRRKHEAHKQRIYTELFGMRTYK